MITSRGRRRQASFITKLNPPPTTSTNMSTTTTMTSHDNSALPLSNPNKSTYQTADTELTVLSLISAGTFNVPSSDPLPSGASFLLEIHRRREQSACPSQRMKRKEREFLSSNMTSMTQKERNLFILDEALDLISKD
jgi:hypothetical protein